MNLFHSENCKLCDYSSYFVDLFYCLPREGEGGLIFSASQLANCVTTLAILQKRQQVAANQEKPKRNAGKLKKSSYLRRKRLQEGREHQGKVRITVLNSKQADRVRQAPDSSKFLDLLCCLPREEGLIFLVNYLCSVEQFPQMILF